LPNESYSIVITPNKWIYKKNGVQQTTSAGDVTSGVNFVHAP
jgi:hypothetical protein